MSSATSYLGGAARQFSWPMDKVGNHFWDEKVGLHYWSSYHQRRVLERLGLSRPEQEPTLLASPGVDYLQILAGLPADLQIDILDYFTRRQLLVLFVNSDDKMQDMICEHYAALRLVTARDRKLTSDVRNAVKCLWTMEEDASHTSMPLLTGYAPFAKLETPLPMRRKKNLFQIFLRYLHYFFKRYNLDVADAHECLDDEMRPNAICDRFCRGYCFMAVVKAWQKKRVAEDPNTMMRLLNPGNSAAKMYGGQVEYIPYWRQQLRLLQPMLTSDSDEKHSRPYFGPHPALIDFQQLHL